MRANATMVFHVQGVGATVVLVVGVTAVSSHRV